jgi:hypothetical protein
VSEQVEFASCWFLDFSLFYYNVWVVFGNHYHILLDVKVCRARVASSRLSTHLLAPPNGNASSCCRFVSVSLARHRQNLTPMLLAAVHNRSSIMPLCDVHAVVRISGRPVSTASSVKATPPSTSTSLPKLSWLSLPLMSDPTLSLE